MVSVEEFLSANDVIKIVQDIQWELRNSGSHLLSNIKMNNDDLMITCINHGDGSEKTPSCGISLRKKVFTTKTVPLGFVHCFACDYKVNFTEFISNVFGYNDRGFFGQKWILDNYISIEQQERPLIELNMERALKQPITYITEAELEGYRYTHPYMYKRKLTDKVIDYFDIGYDKEQDALTFPVKDQTGKVVFIQRRSIHKKFFINAQGINKSDFVYGLYETLLDPNIKELYITESIIDTLYLWSCNKRSIALMGAVLSKEQLRQIRRIPIKKIILALDNDEAGELCANRIKQNLPDRLLYRISFPAGVKDINELSVEEINSLTTSLK